MGRDITQCHPRLQELAASLKNECNRSGLVIGISECLRTVAEQDALYAQGRTEPGNIVTNAKGSSYSSQHQWGIAFDFYRNDGLGAYNESGNFFGKVGEIGKKLGLGWGGDWTSIIDKPHLYLPDWGSTTTKLKQLYGSPEAFMKTWKEMPEDKYGYVNISTGQQKLEVTASSLIVRDTPNGNDTGERYKKGDRVVPYEKAYSGTDRWYRTDKGWVSGYYLTGWVLEAGKWWYLQPGYTYPMSTVMNIDGSYYCFDKDGWMITSDRIDANGAVK